MSISSNASTTILSLSPDVFYHIMWTVSGGWITLNSNADIWALTRVCSQWRTVALDFRTLWSRIVIGKYGNLTASAVAILNECLARSSDSPLHLRVYVDRLEVHANLLDALIPHCHRCCTLNLDTSVFLLKTLDVQMDGRGFPSLKQLQLSLMNHRTQPTDIPDLAAFQKCPELEDVTLNAISRRQCLALNLPWSQLRKLTMIEQMHGDLLDILKLTNNLTSCELVSILPYKRWQAGVFRTSRVLCPSIRNFALFSENDLDLEILDHFLFPNLDTLVVSDILSSDTALPSFLACSSSNLTTLKLSGVLFEDNGLAWMFEGIPAVETLVLEDRTSKPKFRAHHSFDTLVETLLESTHRSSTPLLPRLKSLTFHDQSGDTIDAAGLAALVESRWSKSDTCARIQSISLFCDHTGIEGQSQLEKLGEAYEELVIYVSCERFIFPYISCGDLGMC